MSAPNMLRTLKRTANTPQIRSIVTRTLPKAGGGGGDGHHDDHPHLVFENDSMAFKIGATIIIWGGLAFGIGICTHAVNAAQVKAGGWPKTDEE